ncbi:hypothetical protein IMSAGC019_03502 [Lachnospiraceae bacterium]|nr:hypothetical protein IMSAGC019_03502 [Lachnospiraceae bacterium]
MSAIFDCFDAAVLGLAMDTNMKAALCRQTLENAARSYPALREAVIHSGRGTQYINSLPVGTLMPTLFRLEGSMPKAFLVFESERYLYFGYFVMSNLSEKYGRTPRTCKLHLPPSITAISTCVISTLPYCQVLN